MDYRYLSFDVDDLKDCRRAISDLSNIIWRRHGSATVRRLIIESPFASDRGLQRGQNMRLLRAYYKSGLSVKAFARKIAKENKSLSQDYRYGPNGSTNAATIDKHIRRLKSDPKYMSKLPVDNS